MNTEEKDMKQKRLKTIEIYYNNISDIKRNNYHKLIPNNNHTLKEFGNQL